jgi:hypothetical protein
MTSRVLSRTAVVIATTGLVSAGLLGAAGAKPTPQLAKTHLTIKSAWLKVNANDKYKATITGKLRSHHAPVAGETVGVNERQAGKSKWTATTNSGTTDTNGVVVIHLTQTDQNEQYQLVFAGDSANNLKKSHSGTVTLHKARAQHAHSNA